MGFKLSKERLGQAIRQVEDAFRTSLRSGPVRQGIVRLNGPLASTLGKVQGGLWAAYPAVSDERYQREGGGPILETITLSEEKKAVVFSVEEANIPGTRHNETIVGVVVLTPPDIPYMGFGTTEISVEEEGWELLNLNWELVSHLCTDTQGKFRVDKVLRKLIRLHPNYPHIPLSDWVLKALNCAWGEGPVEVPPECQQWVAEAYQQLGITEAAVWAPLNGIKEQPNKFLRICVHFLPRRMFQAVFKCARAGWSPILPQWQTMYGYQYNRSWDNPCMGGLSFRGVDGLPLVSAESKLLATPAFSGFTLHVPGGNNGFRYQVPPEWERVYLAVMQEMYKTPVPQGDYVQMQEMLRLAARHVPTMIIGGDGSVALYEVGGTVDEDHIATVTTKLVGMLPGTPGEVTTKVKRLVGQVTTMGQNLREQMGAATNG